MCPNERHRAYPVLLENDSLQSVDRCLDAVLRQYMLAMRAFEMLEEFPWNDFHERRRQARRRRSFPNALKANVVEDAVAQLWQHLRYVARYVEVERKDHRTCAVGPRLHTACSGCSLR